MGGWVHSQPPQLPLSVTLRQNLCGWRGRDHSTGDIIIKPATHILDIAVFAQGKGKLMKAPGGCILLGNVLWNTGNLFKYPPQIAWYLLSHIRASLAIILLQRKRKVDEGTRCMHSS